MCNWTWIRFYRDIAEKLYFVISSKGNESFLLKSSPAQINIKPFHLRHKIKDFPNGMILKRVFRRALSLTVLWLFATLLSFGGKHSSAAGVSPQTFSAIPFLEGIQWSLSCPILIQICWQKWNKSLHGSQILKGITNGKHYSKSKHWLLLFSSRQFCNIWVCFCYTIQGKTRNCQTF